MVQQALIKSAANEITYCEIRDLHTGTIRETVLADKSHAQISSIPTSANRILGAAYNTRITISQEAALSASNPPPLLAKLLVCFRELALQLYNQASAAPHFLCCAIVALQHLLPAITMGCQQLGRVPASCRPLVNYG